MIINDAAWTTAYDPTVGRYVPVIQIVLTADVALGLFNELAEEVTGEYTEAFTDRLEVPLSDVTVEDDA